MGSESINLLFGVILLVLIINSTIVSFMVLSLYLRDTQVYGLSAAGSRAPGKLEACSLPPVNGSGSPGMDAAAELVSGPDPDGLIAGESDPDAASGARTFLPSLNMEAPPEGFGTGEEPVPRPTASIGSYLSISLPETPRAGTTPALQPVIPRRSFDGLVTVYTITNQTLPAPLPRIALNLVKPPLVIDYTVSPPSVTDVKFLEYKMVDTWHRENITINRTYEDSWFRIVVWDRTTGEIEGEDGFGRTFSADNPRQLVIWSAGNYTLEFEGEDAILDLSLNVSSDGIVP